MIDVFYVEGKWIGMCGELVGDECVMLFLFGMGLDEFLMSGILILKVKKVICNVNYVEIKVMVEEVFVLLMVVEIEVCVDKFIVVKV